MLFYYHRDYRNLIFNVTNILLKQLLLKQLINEDFSYLYLTKNELDKVIKCFDSNNIDLLIYDTFNDLIILLQLDSLVSNYLYMGLNEIIAELKNNHLLKRLTSELSVLT